MLNLLYHVLSECGVEPDDHILWHDGGSFPKAASGGLDPRDCELGDEDAEHLDCISS